MSLARWVAGGAGSGFSPVAPGTVGSALAAVLGAGVLWVSPWALVAGVVVACGAGWWAIPLAGGEEDPGWVVIDEFAGQWIAMLALAEVSWVGVLAAFVLFRFFDIAKPGPIDAVQRLPGATGVMVDDILAGLAAGACLLAFRWGGIL